MVVCCFVHGGLQSGGAGDACQLFALDLGEGSEREEAREEKKKKEENEYKGTYKTSVFSLCRSTALQA